MTALGFIAVCLATFSLSDMLVRKDGAFGIFRHLRNLLGATQAACEDQRETGRITNALCCVDCTSVWAAAIVVALWVYAPVTVWVLAASGATIVLNRWG